jgi:ERCC4-type nuclease
MIKISIYIDSREQQKLDFSSEYIENVTVYKLPVGDYGCKVQGERVPIIFERKSLSDLFGTLGSGMDRFKKEINRAHDQGFKLIIIIETTIDKILEGYKKSKMSGLGILRTLFTLKIKHNIDFICCKNREEMALYISEYFYSYAKNLIKKGSDI